VDTILNPFLLYGLIALGAIGVCIALPRRKGGPQIFGALIAAAAGGLAVAFLTLKAGKDFPNVYFYIFSGVALGAALRVITHPRPVYAALYFILTIIATAGLFLILSAEFMAFALVIVYAGAILITYLFVIMLATQAPEEDEIEVLTDYDASAREPIAATVVGFLLLAVLTTLLFRGVNQLPPIPINRTDGLLADMPRKVDRVLRNHGVLNEGQTAKVILTDDGRLEAIQISANDGADVFALPRDQWPAELPVKNVEALGFNLLRDHPGTIEIAGVILLMAMLGAVVLSRKQVQLDEDAKLKQARLLSDDVEGNEGTAAAQTPSFARPTGGIPR